MTAAVVLQLFLLLGGVLREKVTSCAHSNAHVHVVIPDALFYRAPTSVVRLDWATLLRRVYDIAARRCPCGVRLRFEKIQPQTPIAAPASGITGRGLWGSE